MLDMRINVRELVDDGVTFIHREEVDLDTYDEDASIFARQAIDAYNKRTLSSPSIVPEVFLPYEVSVDEVMDQVTSIGRAAALGYGVDVAVLNTAVSSESDQATDLAISHIRRVAATDSVGSAIIVRQENPFITAHEERTAKLVRYVGDLSIPALSVIAKPIQAMFPAGEIDSFVSQADLNDIDAVSAFLTAEAAL